jgi:Ca2+/Na+ antiporter
MFMVVADGVVTNVLIQKGIARESNPLLVGVAGESRLIIIKVVGVLLAVLILWDVHRRHPRIALWTSSAFLLIYCGIVAWNLFLLLRGVLG